MTDLIDQIKADQTPTRGPSRMARGGTNPTERKETMSELLENLQKAENSAIRAKLETALELLDDLTYRTGELLEQCKHLDMIARDALKELKRDEDE